MPLSPQAPGVVESAAGASTAASTQVLPWRRRTPYWLVQMRLFATLMGRTSLSVFRSYATTRMPELTSEQQVRSECSCGVTVA